MPHKNWCSINARWSKSSLKHSICFCGILSKFEIAFYCISFFLTYRLHFWNSPAVTIRLLQCVLQLLLLLLFESEIIKISQSSHKMYSNNILNFQVCTANLNACTKKKLIEYSTYIYIYIYIYVCMYMHVYIYIYMYVYIYVFTHTYARADTHTHTTHTLTHTHTHIYIYIYICIYTTSQKFLVSLRNLYFSS